MSEAPAKPHGEVAIRTIAMPADTNPNGDIFGGWLMSQMDLAGATLAFDLAKGRCATVAVSEIKELRLEMEHAEQAAHEAESATLAAAAGGVPPAAHAAPLSGKEG